MKKLEDITFDDVMKSLEKAEWKMITEVHQQKDGPDFETVRYYAQVGDLYVHLDTNNERGIFGWHPIHLLTITTSSSPSYSYSSYSKTLATFEGSKHFFWGEKRRIEKVLGGIYKQFRKEYVRYKKDQRLKELEEEKRKKEEIRDRLRRTFKKGDKNFYKCF